MVGCFSENELIASSCASPNLRRQEEIANSLVAIQVKNCRDVLSTMLAARFVCYLEVCLSKSVLMCFHYYLPS